MAALANVPFAQPHEAPNSWFTRAAAMQGCTAKEFATYLGFSFRQDFDSFYYFAFRKVRATSPQVQGLEAGRIYFDFSRKKKEFGYTLPNPYYRRGRYRFCPLCLQTARVPCIHMYARMRELVFCPWHRCLLEEQCPHCQVPIELVQDMIQPAKGKPGVEDLSLCMQCQQPLHAVVALRIDYRMLNAMPLWLQNWGRNGPGPIEGRGISSERYTEFSERRAKAREATEV
ncbi:hypothetical protein AT984_19760 [Paucibacter sp. KCTC 42545]|nr:hypothetical protein AT984_19760 [Paucibacter sp. KCTC 42545]